MAIGCELLHIAYFTDRNILRIYMLTRSLPRSSTLTLPPLPPSPSSPPSPPPYPDHNFADKRALFGGCIPNTYDVLSNIPFFATGAYGIQLLNQPTNVRLLWVTLDVNYRVATVYASMLPFYLMRFPVLTSFLLRLFPTHLLAFFFFFFCLLATPRSSTSLPFLHAGPRRTRVVGMVRFLRWRFAGFHWIGLLPLES